MNGRLIYINALLAISVVVILAFAVWYKQKEEIILIDSDCVWSGEYDGLENVHVIANSEEVFIRALETLGIDCVEPYKYDFSNKSYFVVSRRKVKKFYYKKSNDRYAKNKGMHVLEIEYEEIGEKQIYIYELPRNMESWDLHHYMST